MINDLSLINFEKKIRRKKTLTNRNLKHHNNKVGMQPTIARQTVKKPWRVRSPCSLTFEVTYFPC